LDQESTAGFGDPVVIPPRGANKRFVIPLAFTAIWLSIGLMVQAESEDFMSDQEQGGRKNITLGAMFREEIKQQEGVKELKNGILYRAEEAGTGKTPKLSDRVKVWYEGRRVNGDVFDQVKEQETREFRLNRDVVQGWQEVVPLMREGDKWEVVIPSHLAYGAKGNPSGKIGPNETLIFRIKLVRVVDVVQNGASPVSP